MKEKSPFDYQIFQDTSIILVNDLRKSLDLPGLKYSYLLHPGTQTRAHELKDYGSIVIDGRPHIRPDGSSYTTAFENIVSPFSYISILGENLAYIGGYQINTKLSPQEIGEQIGVQLFHGWETSPGHYENMVNPDFKEMAVAIGIEYFLEPRKLGYVRARLYGVQIFGG